MSAFKQSLADCHACDCGSVDTISLNYFQVLQFPLEECSSLSDCQSCIGDNNPLCGWCTVENKCSRVSQCQNSSTPMRWVQDLDSCITAVVMPNSISLDNPQTVSVSHTNKFSLHIVALLSWSATLLVYSLTPNSCFSINCRLLAHN